jgi:hypothetical protein
MHSRKLLQESLLAYLNEASLHHEEHLVSVNLCENDANDITNKFIA